jgi:hyperosmotically inducible protein
MGIVRQLKLPNTDGGAISRVLSLTYLLPQPSLRSRSTGRTTTEHEGRHLNQRILVMTSIAAVVVSLAIASSSKGDQADARNAAGTVVGQGDQTSRHTAQSTFNSMDAKVAASSLAQDAKDEVSDAVITTSVKAELAKDNKLSAMEIDVDTDSGRVGLHGTAPSAQAREHATTLAQGVKGVVGVDNQLTVEPTKN